MLSSIGFIDIILLTLFLFHVGLSLLVYTNSSKKNVNKIFALFIFSTSLWPLSIASFRISHNINSAIFWDKLIYLSGTLVPILFLSSVNVLINRKVSHLEKYIFWVPPLFFISALYLSNAWVQEIKFVEYGKTAVLGPVYLFWILYFGAYMTLGALRLYQAYRKSIGNIKNQYRYVLISVAFPVIGSFGPNIILPIFGNYKLIAIGPIFLTVMVIVMAYAIVRHNLLGVKIVTVQIFVSLMLIILFSRLFIANNKSELFINLLVLVAGTILGYLSIKSAASEFKQKERLEHLASKLKELDKQKDEFISIAAHELRTPLTAINGYVSMLLDGDMGELPGEALELLDNTSLAANRMVRLINNLLDVGRIEEGRIVYRMGYVNLADVVKTVYAEFEQEAKMHNLELRLEIQKGIKDKVYVDNDRIHEVVGNLLSNAFKYTEKGSVGVKVLNSSTDSVRVEVKDTGLGISPDDQKKLFKKYYRSKSSKGKIEGTGLGLYVVRLLVEKFGGRVGVISKVDKGSTFWVELPLAKGDEEKHEE